MRFLIFCAIIGSVCALQYPVEYHYHYEGQVASGIPAIRPQVAAFGIRAKLILQMKEKTQGLAKLTDIEIGEYNEDLQCVHLRQPVPFTYQSIPDHHKQILEQPFVVYFLEESGHVMDVPQSDVEFVTNIRKSIVEMLRLEPIVANLGGIKGDQLSKHISGGRAPEAFTVEEESILGRCESEYTIKKLEHHDLQEEKEIIEKHLKKDVQSKSSPRSRTTNIPKLEEEYYRLVRSINFDKCHDNVIQQHAGGANMSDEGHSLFRAVQSRSSVSTYILKGHPGSFRVERATVEGDVIVNPFGFKTEKLQASTNQTLILSSAQPIKRSMILPASVRPVNSWRFEVSSPFNGEGHQKQWINYHNKGDKYYPVSLLSAAGVPLSSQDIQQYQKTVLELLDEVVKEFYSAPSAPSPEDPDPRMTKTSLATTRLHAMTHFMRVLPIDKIREIFSKTFENKDVDSQRKQTFLIDVAAASGASAPIKVLLEKMEKQEISPQRIASIFLTLPNNLYSPYVISDLMEYVKRLDIETHPLLTSSALINFASLAERICVSHPLCNYSIPHAFFGMKDCGPFVLKNFLPFLEEKAKSASKSHERAIYLQAINNLGSSEIIRVLKPYIHGENEKNLRVRSVAIYGLTSLRLPDSARETVFETLMAVVDNTEERSELRQDAFWTLVTWHPSASWWQRMARSTWKEPSRNFATFITLTVESLAKSTEPHQKHQARIAAFVLPLLKPFSPSLRSSYNRIYSRYDPHSKVGINFDFASIKSDDDSAAFQIFTSIRENFGDLNLQLFEGSIAPDNGGNQMTEILNLMRSAADEREHAKMNGRNPSDRKHFQAFNRFQSFNPLSHKPAANIYLRAFQNLYQYIPINADVISKVAGKDGERVLRELLSGTQVHVTKYLNPLDLEFFLPTEIGLPLRGQAVMPTVNLGEADLKLVTPGLQNPTLADLIKHDHLSLRFKSNYKYSSKLIVKLSVLNPLNLKFAEAGVENYAEMNLPLYGDLSLTRSNEIKNVSLSVSPHTQQKFPVFHQHNVPFTVLKKAIPDKDLIKDYKVIGVEKDRKPALKVRKQLDHTYTGISSEVNYSGDAPYPFTSAFLWDYLRNPEQQGKLLASPVSKQWQYSLSWDPSSSKSRNVTLALLFISAHPSSKVNEEGIPDLSVNDDPQLRLKKLKQISSESKIHALNAQLQFHSNIIRRYEVVLGYSRKLDRLKPVEYKEYRVVASAMSSIPGFIGSERALCSDSSLRTPNIYDLNALKSAVRFRLQEQFSSRIYYGRSCRVEEIASATGTLKLSEEREKLLSEELDKICDHDSRDPAIELQTAAVYDVGNLDINFSKDKIPRSILNASYSVQQFIEGALFPHGYYNNMYSGEPNKIKIEARRPVSSKKYSFTVETPRKRSIFSEIHVPYVATKIVPFTGLRTTYDKVTDSLLISIDPYNMCYFRNNSIKTFDRILYDYKPNPCWATLVLNNYNSTDFILRARWDTHGVPQAELKLPDGSIQLLIDYKKVVINGKEMPESESEEVIKDPSGHVIIIVDRNPDGYQVRLLDKLTIFPHPYEIRIAPSALISSRPAKLRGLCGDYDHSSAYDKTGPNGCIYTTQTNDLFQYSWTTTEGDGCDTLEVETMHNKVHDYQKHCQHRPADTVVQKTDTYKLVEDDDCLQTIYPVVPGGSKDNLTWCASYDPTQICKNDCKSKATKFVVLNSGCWPKDDVPPDVAAGEKIGYIYQPPAEKAPTNSSIYGYQDVECVKK